MDLWFLFWGFALSVVCAAASALFGMMPSHADAVYLGLLAGAFAFFVAKHIVLAKCAPTTGNDAGPAAFFAFAFTTFGVVVALPLATLVGVAAWTAFLVGLGTLAVSAAITTAQAW